MPYAAFLPAVYHMGRQGCCKKKTVLTLRVVIVWRMTSFVLFKFTEMYFSLLFDTTIYNLNCCTYVTVAREDLHPRKWNSEKPLLKTVCGLPRLLKSFINLLLIHSMFCVIFMYSCELTIVFPWTLKMPEQYRSVQSRSVTVDDPWKCFSCRCDFSKAESHILFWHFLSL